MALKVVFVQYGPFIEYAQMMVDSCKALGYEVWQLSDMKATKVYGVDKLIREPMNEGRMLYRMRRLTEVEPPYVLLDTDMLVARDISDGFGEDVALTWRERHMIYTYKETTPRRMPYNGGVIFVSNGQFIKDCLDVMEKQEPKIQDWYGDQLALLQVAESGKYKVKELRDERWNFCPDSEGDDRDNVRIYHYKGMRKRFMHAAFRRMYG